MVVLVVVFVVVVVPMALMVMRMWRMPVRMLFTIRSMPVLVVVAINVSMNVPMNVPVVMIMVVRVVVAAALPVTDGGLVWRCARHGGVPCLLWLIAI